MTRSLSIRLSGVAFVRDEFQQDRVGQIALFETGLDLQHEVTYMTTLKAFIWLLQSFAVFDEMIQLQSRTKTDGYA